MLHELQQVALHRGAEAASSVAAEEALAPFDPLLRWYVKGRVRRLLRKAELECPLGEPGHTFRVAYLMGAGKTPVAPEDEEAVAQAYEALGPPVAQKFRGPWLVASVALLAIASTALGFWLDSVRRPFSPKATSAGALLGEQVTSYVAALSRGDAEKMATVRTALSSSAPAVLGDEPARALDAVLMRMEAVRGSGEDAVVDEFRAAVANLSRALATAGLPYFVDDELIAGKDGLQPLLFSYYVQSEAFAHGPQGPVRLVQLWRLDDLNVALGYLGFTRPHTPAAVVLLDQVEEHLVQVTLPAVSPEGRVELVDRGTREKGEAWVDKIEERASVVARAHYAALGEPLASEARTIGTHLAERRELVRKWQSSLRGQGLELTVPRGLFPAIEYEKELELRVPRVDLRTWKRIHDELRARVDAFERLRDHYVAGVERHEVQHRLDYARGLVPVPPLLSQLLRIDNPLDAPPGSLPARVRDEFSAYLASLGAGDSPLLQLLVLSRFMLDGQQQNSVYTSAALGVYLALGREVGVDIDAILARRITRERFAHLALQVWARSPAQLTEAARRAFVREFGFELEEVSWSERVLHQRFRP